MTFCKYEIMRVWNKKTGNWKEAERGNFSETFFPFSEWAPARFVFSFECWRKQSRSLWYCPTHRSEYSIHRGWGDFHVTARYFSSSNIYYKMIYIWYIKQIHKKCVLEYLLLFFHTPWHLPPLAQPGPWREALDTFPDLQHSTGLKNDWLVMNM